MARICKCGVPVRGMFCDVCEVVESPEEQERTKDMTIWDKKNESKRTR